MHKKMQFIVLLIFLSANTAIFSAIDLVTVPERSSVQLTIYNSADITMVSEERNLTFKKGLNAIQFTWAETLIDPTSLRISFKDRKGSLTLLDTVYPQGRAALIWNIQSDFSGSANIEINYFTSGISWKADYTAIANEQEDQLDLQGFIRVINNSGEDYTNAKVRLVVGNINLVEKISDLANSQLVYPKMPAPQKARAREDFNRYMKKAEDAAEYEFAGSAGSSTPKGVIKEGLSEYFIFTIEGRETIPNRWQKQLKSVSANSIALKSVFKVDSNGQKLNPTKIFEFRNQEDKARSGTIQLGKSPLPDGTVQIFTQKNSRLTFLTATKTNYIATGDKVRLNAGIESNIKIERSIIDYKRTDIEVKKRFNLTDYVSNFTEIFDYSTRIENSLNRSIELEIERSFPENFTLKNNSTKVEKIGKEKLVFYPVVPANTTIQFNYQIYVLHEIER